MNNVRMNTNIESYLCTAVAVHESFDDVSSPGLELLSSLSSSGTELGFHHYELRSLPRSSEEFSNTRPALQLVVVGANLSLGHMACRTANNFGCRRLCFQGQMRTMSANRRTGQRL
jgi:hypothetical protein